MAEDIIRWDSGFRWDDGHFWDQPPSFPLGNKKEHKRMAGDYIPSKRADYRAWLLNLKTRAPLDGPTIGAPAGDVTSIVAKCTAQIALIDATDAASTALDTARTAEKTGEGQTDFLARRVLGDWKRLTGMTPAVLASLKAVGNGSNFDPLTYKTEFTVKIVAGEIRIDWKKKEADGVFIFSRIAGTLPWIKIGVDTSSPYIDGHPLATAGVSETREYMLRGMLDDQEIGLDSDVHSITWNGQ
jgi:hypothetical protein